MNVAACGFPLAEGCCGGTLGNGGKTLPLRPEIRCPRESLVLRGYTLVFRRGLSFPGLDRRERGVKLRKVASRRCDSMGGQGGVHESELHRCGWVAAKRRLMWKGRLGSAKVKY